MSLSKNTGQTEPNNDTYKAFEMECFDNPEFSAVPKTNDSAFEPFCTAGQSKHAVFQHMVSDRSKNASMTVDKAEEIITAAKNKAASIEGEAYKKGFAQGEKDGMEMGSKKIDKVLVRIHQVLQEMMTYKMEFTKLHEKEILGLVCRIAERVVRARVKTDHTVVREAIFEAFNLATDRSEVIVKLSPEDIDYVRELRPEFFSRIKELKSLSMESDPSISPGGCFMETAFGDIDGRVGSQLERISKAIEESFEQE